MAIKQKLSAEGKETLMKILEARFEKNKSRHKDIQWADVAARLAANPQKLWSIDQMEASGGEPDVVGQNKESAAYIFFDCCAESPKERRSLCYDTDALLARKEHKPRDSAQNMAEEMGLTLLDEAQYRYLQSLGKFDSKTSSWLKTPEKIRKLGGAIFGDLRFDTVFVYHNGAESYYAGRGFRTMIEV